MRFGIPGSIAIVCPRKFRDAIANKMGEILNSATALGGVGEMPEMRQRLQHLLDG